MFHLPNDNNSEYEKHVAEQGGEYLIKESKYGDLIAKVLCVLAAIVLWFYVVITDTVTDERTFSGVAVSLKNLDIIEETLGLSVITGYNATIDITVGGTKSELGRVQADDIKAYVDLKDIAAPGEYTLEVKTSLPGGISASSMSVNYINVYVDKRTTVSVPVKVMTNYTMESNYTLGTPQVSSETVNVSGPAEELAEIDCARVTLDLGRITKSMSSTGTLELIDKSGAVITNPYIKLQTTEVSVYCPVYTYKEVPLTVSYKYNYYNASNVAITINPAAITIKGDPDALDRINSVSLTQLDEKKIAGDLTQTATIVLPDGIENVSGVSTATVSIVHKGTETRDLVVSNIVVTNPNNLNYSLDTASLTVKFRGAYSKLQMLSQSNIVANIDISYLTNSSGTVEVPVTFTIADALSASVYEIGEYKINVTITK